MNAWNYFFFTFETKSCFFSHFRSNSLAVKLMQKVSNFKLRGILLKILYRKLVFCAFAASSEIVRFELIKLIISATHCQNDGNQNSIRHGGLSFEWLFQPYPWISIQFVYLTTVFGGILQCRNRYCTGFRVMWASALCNVGLQ